MKTLTGAYGRKYKTAAEARKDYHDGLDFIYHNPASRWNGKYCSCRDFPGQIVYLRYNNDMDLVTIKTPEDA